MAVPRVEVESLSYGPHGVARIDGKVCFIRNAAPGDAVDVVVREDHGSYAYGDIAEVIRPGPARRIPPCPYLPRCGGCPWQQVAYATQAAAKEHNVRDLLARIGGLPDVPVQPIAAAPEEYGYRCRLSLRVAGRRLGYFAGASHDLVPVDECLLGVPALRGAIAVAQDWVAGTRTAITRLEIVSRGFGDEVVLVAQAEGASVAADGETTEAFLRRTPRVGGIVVRGRRWRRRWGVDGIRAHAGEDTVEVHAGGFLQVNAAANQALIRTVCEWVADSPEACVLELHAGAGNLTLPLARRVAHVTAVERVATSAADGRVNAHRLGLGNVAFVVADAAAALDERIRQGPRADIVVLDPPRSGAAELVPRLSAMLPRRIVYVSCNPATLARDLRALSDRYQVRRVQPIDFFPQTYHVEAVADVVVASG